MFNVLAKRRVASGRLRNPINIAAFALFATSTIVYAEPFVVEDMPLDMDGVLHTSVESFPGDDIRASSGFNARRPVMADFDGDGKPSWYAGGHIVAHPKEPTPIDPLRFTTSALPSISLPICPACTAQPLAFAVVDVDRDGDTDIVRLNQWAGQSFVYTLQTFLGDGDNGFTLGDRQDSTINTVGSWTKTYVQMRTADYDNDGDIDLALLYTYNGSTRINGTWREHGHLRIRWNNNSSFSNETVLQSQHFHSEAALLSSDFDRDGDVDLMVNYQRTWQSDPDVYFPTTRVFTNQGDGAFVAASDSSFNGNIPLTEGVMFADLDRDNRVEWITHHDNAYYRREYSPDDGWEAVWQRFSDLGDRAVEGDFNEDGFADLVVAQVRELELMRGNANATGTAQAISTFQSDIVEIGVGDAGGDADLDLLVRLANGRFQFIRNTAQRLNVQTSGQGTINTSGGVAKLAVGDGNSDGIQDLYSLRPNASRLDQYLGDGTSFGAPVFKNLTGPATNFVMADFNRDERLDFAYVVPNTSQVRLVTQNFSGFFGWADSNLINYSGAALIKLGNVANYDNRPDLFVASDSNGGILALRNGVSGWISSTPRSSFVVNPSALTVLPRYPGILDTIAACYADGLAFGVNGYSALIGWSQTAQLIQSQSVAQSGVCAAANLDQDAQSELVFVTGDGRLAYWNPTNEPASPFTTIAPVAPVGINAITTTDWNRDGLTDLWIASNEGLILYVRAGVADGWTRRTISSPGSYSDVIEVDINRDTLPDVVYTRDGTIRNILNTSTVFGISGANFPPGQTVTMTPGQSGAAFSINMENPGRTNEDASVAAISATVYFRKVANGAAGAVMTRAEVEQAVASVSILMDGQIIGTVGTGAIGNDGSLQINYNSVFGNVVPIPSGQTKALEYRINLKPTAGAASYTEFWFEQSAITARVVHADGPTGKSSTVPFAGHTVVRISDRLFANGFE